MTALHLVDAEPDTKGFLERHLPVRRVRARPEPRAPRSRARRRSRCGRPLARPRPGDRARPRRWRRSRLRAGVPSWLRRLSGAAVQLRRARRADSRGASPDAAARGRGDRSTAGADRHAQPRGADRRPPGEAPKKEYLLLAQLASDPERVFTKAELLLEVWGYTVVGHTRTLDSHASRLRRKLCGLEPSVSFIDNVWGVGYRLLGTMPSSSHRLSSQLKHRALLSIRGVWMTRPSRSRSTPCCNGLVSFRSRARARRSSSRRSRRRAHASAAASWGSIARVTPTASLSSTTAPPGELVCDDCLAL